jgi:hypothetical protein
MSLFVYLNMAYNEITEREKNMSQPIFHNNKWVPGSGGSQTIGETKRECNLRNALRITEEEIEITSGLGIGGIGSDDYNIHTEPTVISGITQKPEHGQHYAPTGTTEGVSANGRCAQCGRSGSDFNPGAGRYLCPSHWDEY